jgi:hypothetical protein
MKRRFKIKVLEIIENNDGSANLIIDIDSEVQRLLIEKGFVTLLEEMIEGNGVVKNFDHIEK